MDRFRSLITRGADPTTSRSPNRCAWPAGVNDAAEWAQRGLDAFTDRPWQNGPLRELLAELLRSRGDANGAVVLFWQAFTAHPSLDAYRRLLTEADTVATLTEWQQRALAALQGRVAERRADDQSRRSIVSATPASVLIEILLYEGDIEAAWRTALESGCEQRLWLTLARAREGTHPLAGATTPPPRRDRQGAHRLRC